MYEPLLVAHYTRWRYYTSTFALLRWNAYIEVILQLLSGPEPERSHLICPAAISLFRLIEYVEGMKVY